MGVLLRVMGRISWFLVYTFAGASFFWGPNIVLSAVRHLISRPPGDIFERVGWGFLFLILPQFLLPLASVAGFAIVSKLRRVQAARTFCFIALSMLLGIWILGPLAMAINTFVEQGGYLNPEGWHMIPLSTAFFPISTFIGSTYEGMLFAVILASFCLFFLAVGVPAGFYKKLTAWTAPK